MTDNSGLIVLEKETIEKTVQNLFIAVNVPEEHAQIISNSLIDADLKGIHTHGLMRLPIYIRRIQAGLINPCPELKFTSLSRNTSTLNADNALGQVAGVIAMKKAAEQASSQNISIVCLCQPFGGSFLW